VDAGYYRSRSEAIRVGVAHVASEAYERQPAESFAAALTAE
jgi:Arc/MetJ-type ribon-helix-helix transcriptional regulator